MTDPDEPRWLDDRELVSWVRLVSVVELLPGALDGQLQREASLTHFEYFVLAMLSETEDRSLRMTALAARVNATLSRLSHVVTRLEKRGFIERRACPEDGRATNAVLTESGWQKVVATAPGHVEMARRTVLDVLSPEQVDQLGDIMGAVLSGLDPSGAVGSGIRPDGSADGGQAA